MEGSSSRVENQWEKEKLRLDDESIVVVTGRGRKKGAKSKEKDLHQILRAVISGGRGEEVGKHHSEREL